MRPAGACAVERVGDRKEYFEGARQRTAARVGCAHKVPSMSKRMSRVTSGSPDLLLPPKSGAVQAASLRTLPARGPLAEWLFLEADALTFVQLVETP